MRRILALSLALLFLFAAAPQAFAAFFPALESECADGEALVLCDAEFLDGFRQSVYTRSSSPHDISLSVLGSWELEPTSDMLTASADDHTNEPLRIARFGSDMDTNELIAYLKEQSGVVAAEPNYIYYTESISNDPYVDTQWGLDGAYGVHPQDLWSSATESCIVAVIDSGIDYYSTDLSGRIASGLAFDAYPSDGKSPGTDLGRQGHGTHVAGIIAATTNNSAGVAGVMGTAACQIMPVRVFNDEALGTRERPTTFSSDVVAGISHIIRKKNDGNNIVAANMSIGGTWFSSEVMRYALAQLVENDILPVRSAGNDKLYIDDNCVYPSIFETPGVTAVAAIDANGRFDASYSNYSNVCVQTAAPGTDILSTWFNGRGGYVGTSGSLKFDSFENTNTYTVKYAPYTWNSGVIESDAVILPPMVPQNDGYLSARSLQFPISPSSEYSDFRIILPNDYGQVRSDQSLGFRLRFTSSQPLPNEYSLASSIGEKAVKPTGTMSACELDRWYYFSSNGAVSGSELSLWVSLYDLSAPVTVCIDNIASTNTSQTSYNIFEGTSMAAPFFTGAYALLRSVYPDKSMAELRARLIGGSRSDVSLTSRVNAGGSVDIPTAVLNDTSSFAPVIDKISQNGNTVTVDGWFFGDAPAVSLGAQSIPAFTQTGSTGKCSLSFEIPTGVSGIQTLTLSKSNGRSYRMRYDYSPRGNMTVLGAVPESQSKDTIARDIFSYDGRLYYLISTADGFGVSIYENGTYSDFIFTPSTGDRASRDDFSTFIDGSILYIYDFDHIHSFDMSSRQWQPDIVSPYTLDSSRGFLTGAVAIYNGRLMLIGGKGSGAGTSIKVYGNSSWTDGEIIDSSFTLHAARAIAANGKLVVFTTESGGFSKRHAVFVFDGQSWTRRVCPYADICSCSFAALNGEILCFGDSMAKEGILAYSPSSDSWRRLPYRGTGLAYTARGTLAGSRIYAITGLQGSDKYILQYADIPNGGGSSETAPSNDFVPASYGISRKQNYFTVPGTSILAATGFYLDDMRLEQVRDYTILDNSLCLTEAVLSRLSNGEHRLRIVFPDGSCSSVFLVKDGRLADMPVPVPPATGAASLAPLIILALSLCAVCLLKIKRLR